jgi:hypothetical protein
MHLQEIRNPKQVYVIFSVDTEHDLINKYRTKSAGWSKGIPLLFKAFDSSKLRGKVCWLLEYNLKDGIVAANPDSEYYVKEFSELINKMKSREDELGLHPTMLDWVGGEGQLTSISYNSPDLWDDTRRSYDPDFVMYLITSAKKNFTEVCGVDPVGCRTGNCSYAAHLGKALWQNGIRIDSSVNKSQWYDLIRLPNAYYAADVDIRRHGTTNVLEIQTVWNINNSSKLKYLRKIQQYWLLHLQRPLFLSFNIHNYQAITSDGEPDQHFLDFLISTVRFLASNGAQFLNWTDARELYAHIHTND